MTAYAADAATRTVTAPAKEVMERAIAALALIALTPLFLVVAIAIKLTDGGPVFFQQSRTGQNGRPFDILKFRSMTQNAGLVQATKNDARVTRIGAILRRTSIDELPQLINVLRGEMAIVGPRPHAVAHDAFYANAIPGYMGRYTVKPGLTGWAQVNNSRGETETVAKMARRAALDLDYVAHRTLALDLLIIVRTPLALVTTDSAY